MYGLVHLQSFTLERYIHQQMSFLTYRMIIIIQLTCWHIIKRLYQIYKALTFFKVLEDVIVNNLTLNLLCKQKDNSQTQIGNLLLLVDDICYQTKAWPPRWHNIAHIKNFHFFSLNKIYSRYNPWEFGKQKYLG